MTQPASEQIECGFAVDRAVEFFETLSPQTLRQLQEFYGADARFKDPFNEVEGTPAITKIFEHMFASLHEPRFVVTGRVVQGMQCFLTWDFHFAFQRSKTQEQVIRGASHIVFSPGGQITLHRDYWDAAEELYEKLPIVGSVMRWLKKQANG
jgi:hypothetical protein